MSLTRPLLSVDLGRGTRRFQRFVVGGGAKPSGEPPKPRGVLDPDLLRAALPQSVRKLDPRKLIRNPVMFVVEITAVLVTIIAIANVTGIQPVTGPAGLGFQVQIGIWLWFTVLFATYAEAVAEARGRAQAATLRKTRSETTAHRRQADGTLESVGSSELRKGDIIVIEEGETIPGDGDVIEGVGYVNEAAITGESAPVLKEPGTDIRSSVTGGTTLTSDSLVVQVTADPGETFLDRMIALVEGAKRQRTPNEIALAILLAGLTIVFLMAVVTLRPFGQYAGIVVDTVALVALLVCLIPTTIGGLLSAIGIAGMDRVARFNVLAMSGRAVEASGDVDVILLDKTGTITYGNRLAASITPAPGVSRGRRGPRRARLVHPGHDARGSLDRGPRPNPPGGARRGRGRWRRRRARQAVGRDCRRDPVPGRDPDERGQDHGRDRDPQGRRRRHRQEGRRAARRDHRRLGPDRRPRRHAPGARERGRGPRASSSSRTRSRRASSSGSRSSARWASGP